MPEQFENPEVTKLEDEKAAEKASHTEQSYDEDHQIISK